MKTRFTTIDIKAAVFELRQKLLGLRVVNVYDVDNKTYLIKLAKPDQKDVLLLESGCRFHTTEFEWPKSMMPSGFAMKMRKHLKSRRLERLDQVGEDRIVDLQFGSNEAAYHIILELYDRGNIVLTDHEYLILNILRPRTDESQDVRFAVREKYPLDCARQPQTTATTERLCEVLSSAKAGDDVKKTLLPHFIYGPAVIDHSLLVSGLSLNSKIGKDVDAEKDMERLMSALTIADDVMTTASSCLSKGYIIQQRQKKAAMTSESAEIYTYSEFHPHLFHQHSQLDPAPLEFESFNKAVDEFFSKIESQKLDVKLLQQEKAALKKLENVKTDHAKRLDDLAKEQTTDMQKAQLIEINLSLVERAIAVVRSLVASQVDWLEMERLVAEAVAQGDPVAASIKSLKLQTNHITMLLQPQRSSLDADLVDSSEDEGIEMLKPTKLDIDLGLSAYSNACKYFNLKRHAAQKQQKTINASTKALKSAERKTKQTLKEVQTTATINKARRTYWFEKFLWCISSENYLMIGGRDQQQNEVIVKRYMRPGDLYVHADLHGASSIVVKNPSKLPVPPKTLNEAGTMALCYSAAWDARVITSAWWVYHDQVSKTAPTGEYLTTGSFMIRGKKNFLSPSHLIYGFGFLFKLDESCVSQHANERKVKTLDEEDSVACEASISVDSVSTNDEELDLEELAKAENNSEGLAEETDDDEDDDDGTGQSEDIFSSVLRNADVGNSDDIGGSSVLDSDADISEDVISATPTGQTDPHGSGDEISEDDVDLAMPTGQADHSLVYSVDTETLDLNSGSQNSQKSDAAEEFPAEEFPDTSIDLQHISGSKFSWQTSSVGRSTSSHNTSQPSMLAETSAAKQSGRLSAKQRRELKKGRQKVQFGTSATDGAAVDDEDGTKNSTAQPDMAAGSSLQNSQPTQVKRGQKSKMKKIQEKYGDQDEEERQLRLHLLASAGAPKEDIKAKKGKKGKDGKTGSRQQQQQQQSRNRQQGKLTISDITSETPTTTTSTTEVPESGQAELPGNLEVDDDDDSTTLTQDAAMLDSLTGIPLPEDILLFCIPVCAPYSALTNYRYKVKLVPGTTKRGKATKLALDMFVRDRSTTAREKDLFRSVKDTDLSRNIPGKVKVSAPNLHAKQKHK